MSTDLGEEILGSYRALVEARHPSRVYAWPIISGSNRRMAELPGGLAIIFDHTGVSSMTASVGLPPVGSEVMGQSAVKSENALAIAAAIEAAFHLRPLDGVVVLQRAENGWILPNGTFERLLANHELYMGLAPMKIFLSHKGVDKEMVRRFERLLRFLGFDPWLDEDAMPAGSQPDRAIQKGFKDSCAAVFFVTPDFKDETWLATEIEYARKEKREKGERFAIITLCLSKDDQEGNVPELLTHFIYKKPKHELDAMLEILRALPIRVGAPHFP